MKMIQLIKLGGRNFPEPFLKYPHSVLFVAIQSLLRHHLRELWVGPGDFSQHGEAHFRLVKDFDWYFGVTWLLRIFCVLTDDLYESRIWHYTQYVSMIGVWVHARKVELTHCLDFKDAIVTASVVGERGHPAELRPQHVQQPWGVKHLLLKAHEEIIVLLGEPLSQS